MKVNKYAKGKVVSRREKRMGAREWRKHRMRALHRDGFRCVQCGKAGRLEVDHIVPLSAGGSQSEPHNLQTLCRDCHIRKTRRENTKPATRAEKNWNRIVQRLAMVE